MSYINTKILKQAEMPDMSIPPDQAAAQQFSKHKPGVHQMHVDMASPSAIQITAFKYGGNSAVEGYEGWDGHASFNDGVTVFFQAPIIGGIRIAAEYAKDKARVVVMGKRYKYLIEERLNAQAK